MKSVVELNNELDKVFINLSKIDNEIENILFPIYKIINNNNEELKGFIPVNVTAISIDKIIERLRFLLTEIFLSGKFDESSKNKINLIIRNAITELEILSLDQKEESRKIINLYILINNRKEYVLEKYNILKDIDLKIKEIENKINNSNKENIYDEFNILVNKKKEIVSDDELCEDLKVLFDYDNFDNDNIKVKEKEEIINLNNVNTTQDLYKLVDITIKKQMDSYMEYRYLCKNKVNELREKLRLSTKRYVDSYVLNNYDLSTNIYEFNDVLNSILKGELENYFEIKNGLGIDYVETTDNNKLKTITIKEVVERKYTGFENNIINKYSTLLELSQVDEDNIDIVRRFVINMGPEFVPIFDKLWLQVNTKVRTKILEQKKYGNKKENI